MQVFALEEMLERKAEQAVGIIQKAYKNYKYALFLPPVVEPAPAIAHGLTIVLSPCFSLWCLLHRQKQFHAEIRHSAYQLVNGRKERRRNSISIPYRGDNIDLAYNRLVTSKGLSEALFCSCTH